MFLDRKKLRKELIEGVGFYQSNNSDLPVLSPFLSSSLFDRYVNSVHPLLTNENIDASIANSDRYNYDAYKGNTIAYDAEEVLIDTSTNIVYESIKNVPIGTLITDTNFWFPYDEYNEYCYQTLLRSVDKALDSVFNSKKVRHKVKSIHESISLFKGAANQRNLIKNADKFVGLRFIAKRDRDIVSVIKNIGHQFTEAVSFNMYLLHSSQVEPLLTIPINHTKPKSSQWTNVEDLVIRYLSDEYDAGGEFFLGYNQSELGTAQALKMDYINWIDGNGCKTCPRDRSFISWKTYSEWVSVESFSISESSFAVGVDLIDTNSVSYEIDNNYGLNANITTECDLTDFVVDEKHLYAQAICDAAGLELLRGMGTNVRTTNQLSNTVREEARQQTATFDGVTGATVYDMVQESFKGLSFDLSGLNSACLPCDDGRKEIMLKRVTLR